MHLIEEQYHKTITIIEHHQPSPELPLATAASYLPPVRKLLSNCFAYETLSPSLSHYFFHLLIHRFFCSARSVSSSIAKLFLERFLIFVLLKSIYCIWYKMQKSRALFSCSNLSVKSIRLPMCRHLIMDLSFGVCLHCLKWNIIITNGGFSSSQSQFLPFYHFNMLLVCMCCFFKGRKCN